jgi:hypothetical protein
MIYNCFLNNRPIKEMSMCYVRRCVSGLPVAQGRDTGTGPEGMELEMAG